MDIASVYLNLASLLGTEIEVEGYYAVAHWPERVFLYGIEHEPASERIFLPQFIGHKNLVNTYSAPMRAKIVFKGHLTQNARGDPLLHRITSISYKTDVVIFQVSLKHQENDIVCQQSTDLIFNWMAYFQGQHLAIRDLTSASAILSKPVLLEGHLIPYVSDENSLKRDVRLTMAIKEIIYGLSDLWQHDAPPSASDVMQLLLGARFPWAKTRTHRGKSDFDVKWHNQILIPPDSQTLDYLDRYFGASSRRESGYRLGEYDPKFTFAGIFTSLDDVERKDNRLPPRVRLKFTSIDYITARRTIVFRGYQDE
jgi:hypothetical protein